MGQISCSLFLLLLLLLLWPFTESETPWTGRSETCPTPRQNEVGTHRRTSRPNQLSVISVISCSNLSAWVSVSINMPLRSWRCAGGTIKMPLLTELAETVVDSDSYKHAAPTELAVSWRSRCCPTTDQDEDCWIADWIFSCRMRNIVN